MNKPMNKSKNVVPFARMAPVGVAPKEWWHSELLEYTHDAVIVWELGGKGILYWNRAAEMLYGYLREEARGRITHELLKTELSCRIEDLEDAIARHGVWAGKLKHTARNGSRITVQARLVLLPRVDGRWLVAEFNHGMSEQGQASMSQA